MIYTQYLIDKVNSEGAPQMDAKAFEAILKIIYLEGRCDGMKGAMTSMRDTDMPHFFDVRFLNLDMKLTALTGNFDPKKVFEDILRKPH